MSYESMLSHGAIKDMIEQKNVQFPILQVILYNRIFTQKSEIPKFQLVLSDGQYCYQFFVMMGKMQVNQLEPLSIIRLKKYLCNVVRNKCIISMVDVDLMLSGCKIDTLIGTPVEYDRQFNCDDLFDSNSFSRLDSFRLNLQGEKRQKVEGGYVSNFVDR